MAFNMSTLRTQGFTLIELMIVLVIIGVLMGLVGGLSVGLVSSASARNEEMALNRWIKATSSQAFHRYEVQQYSFDRTRIYRLQDEKESSVVYEFDYLTFEQQQLSFNQFGMPSVFELHYLKNGQTHKVNLARLLGVPDAEQP